MESHENNFRKTKLFNLLRQVLFYDNYVIICFSIINYVFESIMIFFYEFYYTIKKKILRFFRISKVKFKVK